MGTFIIYKVWYYLHIQVSKFMKETKVLLWKPAGLDTNTPRLRTII